MSDVTMSSDVDEKRAKRLESAKQKFDRLFNQVVAGVDALSNHTRSTAGILTSTQVETIKTALTDRFNVLGPVLDAHASAPAQVRAKAKPAGISLF